MGLRGAVKRWIIRRKVNDIKEGKMGNGLKKLYWWLAGKKTLFSLALMFIGGGLYAIGEPELAERVAKAAALGVSVGLVDKAYRAQPPRQ